MPAKMPIRFAFAALLAAGGAVFAAHADTSRPGQIGLQPASVDMEIAPGQAVRKVVTIANLDRTRPVSVSLSLGDWAFDAAGAPAFISVEETDSSATGWARFGASTVSLAPGQSKQVVVRFAAPEKLTHSGDYRFALLASTVLKDASGSWKKHQTASLFSLAAGKAKSRPFIAGSRLTVTADGKPAIGLDLANHGNSHARLEGVIEILGEGDALQTVAIRDLIVPERGTRSVLVPLEDALPVNPEISVRLTNVFAPQRDDETEALPLHRVKLESEVAELSIPVAGLN